MALYDQTREPVRDEQPVTRMGTLLLLAAVAALVFVLLVDGITSAVGS
jgi:hypothetical protein